MDVSTVTDSLAADYRTLTEQVGLVDRSERGKLALTGGEAKEFLHGQVSQDIESLTPGHGAYAAFLTHKGKMLGDLRVLDLGDELWLDTERVALQELFNMIRRYKLGRDVELHKRTVERSLLSLVGPGARDLLAVGPAEHDNARTELGIAVATDVGVDLICDAERTDEVKAALGVPEVGEAVAEIVRVEHGRPRYGLDLDDSVIPQEAGLNERAVSFTKGCYVGQETVARLHYRGKPNRHLRGLRLSRAGGDRRAAAARRARGRPRRHVRRLPRPRPDRAGAGAARGRARRHRGRRRGDRHRRRAALLSAYFGGIDAARAAPTSTQRASAASSSTPSGSTSTKPGHRLAAGAAELVHVRLAARGLRLLRFDAHHQLRLAHHADRHVAADHPAHAAEHLALDHIRARCHQLSDARRQLLVVGHSGTLSRGVVSRPWLLARHACW